MNDISIIFTYTVADENLARYEEIRKQGLEVSESETGTLMYEIYKDDNGLYCQHERFASEADFIIHAQNTAESTQEWYSLVEMKSVMALGNISDEFKQQFQLQSVFKTEASVKK